MGIKKRYAWFRFYEELNQYLPENKRKRDFKVSLERTCSVQTAIVSLGVPLSEIDLILVNGESVNFSQDLYGNERVSIYPVFELLNIENVTHLRKIPLRRLKFITAGNLFDLAQRMNELGFDAKCRPNDSADEIVEMASQEKRVILTKNADLLQAQNVTHALLIRSEKVEDQVKEIVHRLDL
jgi:hypothetical protein